MVYVGLPPEVTEVLKRHSRSRSLGLDLGPSRSCRRPAKDLHRSVRDRVLPGTYPESRACRGRAKGWPGEDKEGGRGGTRENPGTGKVKIVPSYIKGNWGKPLGIFGFPWAWSRAATGAEFGVRLPLQWQ